MTCFPKKSYWRYIIGHFGGMRFFKNMIEGMAGERNPSKAKGYLIFLGGDHEFSRLRQYSKSWCDVTYDAVVVKIVSFHVIKRLVFSNQIEAMLYIAWISKFPKRFWFAATDDLSNRKLSVSERCPATHRLWQHLFPRGSIKNGSF